MKSARSTAALTASTTTGLLARLLVGRVYCRCVQAGRSFWEERIDEDADLDKKAIPPDGFFTYAQATICI